MTERLKSLICPIIEKQLELVVDDIDTKLKEFSKDPKFKGTIDEIGILELKGFYNPDKRLNQIIKIYKILCKD